MAETYPVHPQAVCPHCGREIGYATGIEGAPSAGDYSCCMYCGTFLRFIENLKVRELSLEEFKAAPKRVQRRLRLVRWGIMLVRNERN